MQFPSLILRRRNQVLLGGAAVVVLLIVGCSFGADEMQLESSDVYPVVEVFEISSGLERTFTVTGEVEALRSANFLSDFVSTIETIDVSIGDIVSAGEQLLTLKAEEVQQDLTTANDLYINTAQSLQQTRIVSNQTVSEAQIALKSAQINLEKLQKETAAKRIQAEETLASTKLTQNLSEDTSRTSLDNAIRKTQTIVRDALTDADDLLEFSPVQEGLSYVKETHLGVRDPSHKLRTEDALMDTYTNFQKFVPSYSKSLEILAESDNALSMLLTVLLDSVSSPEYTQATINSNIDTVNGHITSIRTVISELESAKRTLDSTVKKSGIVSQVLIDAEAAYTTTIAGLEASLKKAELEVERAKTALDSAIAAARSQEISALSSVTSARGTLDLARISSDKLAIVAPFDGVVTDIPVRIGREVQPGELVLAMEDPSELKVVSFVSTVEVKNLTLNSQVTVEGDRASIRSISPTADAATKKYKVEVDLDSEELLPGQLVSLTYLSDTSVDAPDTIYLSVTAVHISAAETFVWVIDEPKQEQDTSPLAKLARKRSITIGELEGRYVEITSGLGLGDQVIVEGGRALTEDGQLVSPRSL